MAQNGGAGSDLKLEEVDLTIDQAAAADPETFKLPPCDQCRKRKVKCDGRPNCRRCAESSLGCTRDIQRKKRGPKKGSGSVIARLRNEHEQHVTQETTLPSFSLAQLDLQLPRLNRTESDGSAFSSPSGTPSSSQFGDTFLPNPDTAFPPRSVPIPHSVAPSWEEGVPQWPLQTNQALQYSFPGHPDGLVSVNDLAQQIFHDAPLTPLHSKTPPLSQVPSRMATPGSVPLNMDSMVTGSMMQPLSPTTTSNSSPPPAYGPKYLYRSNSAPVQAEPRIQALSRECGMSAYLMTQCVKQFFQHLYPIMPVIHESTFRQRLASPEDLSTDEKVLVLSMCATTVLHCAPVSDLSLEAKKDLGKQFLNFCLDLRRTSEWIETAGLSTIISGYFISLSYFEIKQPKSHHFYLREAIGMAHEQGLHLSSTYAKMYELQAILASRTFALLFITERGCAILRNKPAFILQLRQLPSIYFDDHDNIVLAGFSALVELFKLLDQRFVELWRSSPGDTDSGTPLANIEGIQHSLNSMSFDGLQMTDIQKADVLITHQWLRLIFWQASMRQGLVSTNAEDPIFFYDYPITVAKDLCSVMHQLTFDAILVHGLGIFEKIFEVAYTLMDALTLKKQSWAESQELRYLFSCLSASPNSHNTYVKMLQNKMDAE